MTILAKLTVAAGVAALLGSAAGATTTTMPLGTATTGLDYFVWNNTSRPQDNASWNYFFNPGNVVFTARFDDGTTLGNRPTGGDIAPFGFPDTQTYGEVFTAPADGKLTSFSLDLNGGVGRLYGVVGTWNGGDDYGFGHGSDKTLFESGVVPSVDATRYLFKTDVAVVAGQQYVAYLSTYGLGEADPAKSVGAVPEPAAWVMMIGGFGLVGASLRRRHAAAVAA